MSHMGFGQLGIFISSLFLLLLTQTLTFFTLALKAEKTPHFLPPNICTCTCACTLACNGCPLPPAHAAGQGFIKNSQARGIRVPGWLPLAFFRPFSRLPASLVETK